MKDKIEIECLTCKKQILSMKQYNICFNRNHRLHSTGTLIIRDANELTPNVKIGTVLTNAKAGEKAIVRLE
jgi:hypothetical protein